MAIDAVNDFVVRQRFQPVTIDCNQASSLLLVHYALSSLPLPPPASSETLRHIERAELRDID